MSYFIKMADYDYFLLESCFWVEMWFKTLQKRPLTNAPTSFSLYFLFLYQFQDVSQVVQEADNLLLKCLLALVPVIYFVLTLSICGPLKTEPIKP